MDRDFDPTIDRFPVVMGLAVPLLLPGKITVHGRLRTFYSQLRIDRPDEYDDPCPASVSVGTADEHVRAFAARLPALARSRLARSGDAYGRRIERQQNADYQAWLESLDIDEYRAGTTGVELRGRLADKALGERELASRQEYLARHPRAPRRQLDPSLQAFFDGLCRFGLDGMSLVEFHRQLTVYLEANAREEAYEQRQSRRKRGRP